MVPGSVVGPEWNGFGDERYASLRAHGTTLLFQYHVAWTCYCLCVSWGSSLGTIPILLREREMSLILIQSDNIDP